MKTPRDILLSRHRAAGPALDAIRERVLAGELGRRETAGETSTEPGWLALAWQQLVLPCRAVWAGLGVAWVVICLLWLATAEPARIAPSTAPRRNGDSRAQLKQQWLLRAELLDIATVRPQPPVAVPGPHSEATPVRTTQLRPEEMTAV